MSDIPLSSYNSLSLIGLPRSLRITHDLKYKKNIFVLDPVTAYDTLYRSKHKDVRRERLETSRDLGGFGFTPLRFRLIKARAQWAGDVLFRPELPASIRIRKRIIHTMSLDPRAYKTELRAVWRDEKFIRGPRPVNLSWIGVFSPDNGQWFFPSGWRSPINSLQDALPARWQDYLRGWCEEVSSDTSHWIEDRWRISVYQFSTVDTDLQLRQPLQPGHANLGQLNAPLNPPSANSRILANRGLIIPKEWWQDHFPALTKVDWKRQWCLLKAVSRASPGQSHMPIVRG